MSDTVGTSAFINREQSLLAFNQRVLAQASRSELPLFERLRYLCISSTNLDEFFEIRVAGLQRKVEAGVTKASIDGLTPQQVLAEIRSGVSELVAEQYRVLNEELIPALAAEGVRTLRRGDWSPAQEQWLRSYFERDLLPILSPIGLDVAHPFPRILNKSLNFIISLSGNDAFGRESRMAIVQVPRALSRIVRLPKDETGSGENDFVFLSSIIHAFVDQLFDGMQVIGCYQFRVTRNGDLMLDPEEVEDLLRAVAGELPSRRYGDAVRLELDGKCPQEVAMYLLEQFELDREDLYQLDGPVNLNRMLALIDHVSAPALCFKPFIPQIPERLIENDNVFAAVHAGDILLHHPFESFSVVVDFIRQAAIDPDVLAIKQTLYRTGPDSIIVDSLVAAARAGKEVTVVIELRARFDEEANVALATRLQGAGAHVVYGVVGYKTHAKMALVVRRENRQIVYYGHLGTGNYHPRTSRIYTDYGLLTCDQEICQDMHRVFLQLTSLGRVTRLNCLLQSPFTLHMGMLQRIHREVVHANEGHGGRIILKINSLVDPELIEALYKASCAGVEIDLIVRGVCCLRPGVPGVSERIRVRSIVGRFLEHTRVYYFANDGAPEVYCSSADWMDRNMFRRVEVAFPLKHPAMAARVVEDLGYYLRDNCNAWQLHADGSYTRMLPEPDGQVFCAQEALLSQYGQ